MRSLNSIVCNTKPALHELGPLVELWFFRLLVPLGCHQIFVDRDGFKNDCLANFVQLDEWLDIGSHDFVSNEAQTKFRQLYVAAERKCRNAKAPADLADNVARLGKLLALSEIDCRLLELAVLVHTVALLEDLSDWLGEISSRKVVHLMAALIERPVEAVSAALSPQGLLAKSGLLAIERRGTEHLKSKLNLLSDSFADRIVSSDADPYALFRDTVAIAPQAELGSNDFGHIVANLSVLRPYLRHAVFTNRKGVNLFVHGSPGTGKSQLARVLAQELGCELFEVAWGDSDGIPVDGMRRLRAFRAGQCVFSNRGALMVFDEAEDVFNDGNSMFGLKSTAQLRKAWINRMLEGNAIPTIWLSNNVNGMDPAFVRRFDMVFELTLPPAKQRQQIIRKLCGDMLEDASAVRFSESDTLTPGVVARTASVVGTVADELKAKGVSNTLEMLICNSLRAQGHPTTARATANHLTVGYDPAFINTDIDVTQIPSGLLQSKSGRLCLYGPPGTGKTAFAAWLATQLHSTLMVKRASDLMSMYVGDSEKSIAQAFKQAEQDRAMLFIDEVDSFLQVRRGSKNNWDARLVNEMLTQIEAFPGVLIASTNLIAQLDPAALRRFDLKVKFDFLKPKQAFELLKRTCTALNVSAPQACSAQKLTRLARLTPGDFASVSRQHQLRPLKSAIEFVVALELECALKNQPAAAVGFL